MEALITPRIRSYFRFDPTEFVDDVVVAVSSYINAAIESLSAMMADIHVSQSTKKDFKEKIIKKMQQSLLTNADIFEGYLLRNIFSIPIEVDLAEALTAPSTPKKSFLEDGTESVINEEEDEVDYDSQLDQLYKQIHQAQEKNLQLAQENKALKIQVMEDNKLKELIPKMLEIAKEAEQLSANEIEQLCQQMKNLQMKFNTRTIEPVKYYEMQRANFTFE